MPSGRFSLVLRANSVMLRSLMMAYILLNANEVSGQTMPASTDIRPFEEHSSNIS